MGFELNAATQKRDLRLMITSSMKISTQCSLWPKIANKIQEKTGKKEEKIEKTPCVQFRFFYL